MYVVMNLTSKWKHLNMKSCFADMGYTESVLNRTINIANNTERGDLLHDNTNEFINRNKWRSNNVPFFFPNPFNFEFHKIKNTIEKYLPVHTIMTLFMSRFCPEALYRCPVEPLLLAKLCLLASISADYIGCSSMDLIDAVVVDVHIAPASKQGRLYIPPLQIKILKYHHLLTATLNI